MRKLILYKNGQGAPARPRANEGGEILSLTHTVQSIVIKPYGGIVRYGLMRKYARSRRKLARVGRQARICTPPGGAVPVVAKICAN